MDTNSISHHDDNTGNRITKGKQPKRSAADCESIYGTNNQSKRKMNKECKGKMLRSIENILPSTSTNGTSYSYVTGTKNIPSTSANDPSCSYSTGTEDIPCTSSNDPSCSYSTGTEDIPSTSTNDPSCSYSTGSENIEPNTNKPETNAFNRLRKSKSKKLQGLTLEKAEIKRIRTNQRERERHRVMNEAYNELRKLDIPYNAKLAAEHNVETRIYAIKNATEYIRDLLAILEDSDRYLTGSRPLTAYMSSDVSLNQSQNLKTVGTAFWKNQFHTSSSLGMGPEGNHSPCSATVGVEPVGNEIQCSENVGLGSVNNNKINLRLNCLQQILTNLKHPSKNSGQTRLNFCSSSSNQQYRGQIPGLMLPPTSAGATTLCSTLPPRQDLSCKKITFVSQVNITPKTGISVKHVSGTTLKAGISRELFSGITPDSRPEFPHFSSIHQVLPSPMTSWQCFPISSRASTSQSYTSTSQSYTSTSQSYTSTSQSYTSTSQSYTSTSQLDTSTSQSYNSPIQPYTSTPVSGNQFMQWHQSLNNHSDFILRPNCHNQVNVTANQPHGQLTYSGKFVTNLQNTSASNNHHINDSVFLDMHNISKIRQNKINSNSSTDSNPVLSRDISCYFSNNSIQDNIQGTSQCSTGSVHQTGGYRYSQYSTHNRSNTNSGMFFSSNFDQVSCSRATNLGYTSNLSVKLVDQYSNWGSNVNNNVWSGQYNNNGRGHYNNDMSGHYDNNCSFQYSGRQSGD